MHIPVHLFRKKYTESEGPVLLLFENDLNCTYIDVSDECIE